MVVCDREKVVGFRSNNKKEKERVEEREEARAWVDKSSGEELKQSTKRPKTSILTLYPRYLLIYSTVPIISLDFSTRLYRHLLFWSLFEARALVYSRDCSLKLIRSLILFIAVVFFSLFFLFCWCCVFWLAFLFIVFCSCLNSLNYLLSMPLILCIERGLCVCVR